MNKDVKRFPRSANTINKAGLAVTLLSVGVANAPAWAESTTALPEVTVTGTREGEKKVKTPLPVTVINGKMISKIGPAHPSELVGRVPGAVVMPTTGEGHTTGLRQPIGTDAVYLYLEDGVPTRSTGFFNHNAMYEMNLPQAGGFEVIRGPGSSLHGSDAIGGVFNALTKAPSLEPETSVSVEVGSHEWYRGLFSSSDTWGDLGARGDLNLTHTGGWRKDTAYDRQSATIRVDNNNLSSDATLKTVFSATNINQETGANSRLRENDYYNNPTRNYTPIAFRTVQAARLSVDYEKELNNSLVSVIPYMRWNTMGLLPSWQLSYDPVVYDSGHWSLGMMSKYRHDFEPWNSKVILGADLDYSPGYRKEKKITTTKSDALTYASYTEGATVYDYDVTFMQASPYIHGETSPVNNVWATAGLRADVMRYEYDNQLGPLTTTNWRRPESDKRSYSHLSPALGLAYTPMPEFNPFVRYKHSFRTPSESQLFRQGSNTDTIHLQPVKVDAYDVGFRGDIGSDFNYELVGYRMNKRDDILTTQEVGGTRSTNSGKTQHTGIETGFGYQFLPEWKLDGAWSRSKHVYKHWVSSAGDYSGKKMLSAPDTVSTVTLGYTPAFLEGLSLEGEWFHMGSYMMNDANTRMYDGYNVYNLRGAYDITNNVSFFARVMNLTDVLYATNAVFTNNRNEYVPGMPLTLYSGLEMKF